MATHFMSGCKPTTDDIQAADADLVLRIRKFAEVTFITAALRAGAAIGHGLLVQKIAAAGEAGA